MTGNISDYSPASSSSSSSSSSAGTSAPERLSPATVRQTMVNLSKEIGRGNIWKSKPKKIEAGDAIVYLKGGRQWCLMAKFEDGKKMIERVLHCRDVAGIAKAYQSLKSELNQMQLQQQRIGIAAALGAAEVFVRGVPKETFATDGLFADDGDFGWGEEDDDFGFVAAADGFNSVDDGAANYEFVFDLQGPAVKIEWPEGVEAENYSELSHQENLTLVYCTPDYKVVREPLPWLPPSEIQGILKEKTKECTHLWKQKLIEEAEFYGVQILTEADQMKTVAFTQEDPVVIDFSNPAEGPQWVGQDPSTKSVYRWPLMNWSDLDSMVSQVKENIELDQSIQLACRDLGVAYQIGELEPAASSSAAASSSSSVADLITVQRDEFGGEVFSYCFLSYFDPIKDRTVKQDIELSDSDKSEVKELLDKMIKKAKETTQLKQEIDEVLGGDPVWYNEDQQVDFKSKPFTDGESVRILRNGETILLGFSAGNFPGVVTYRINTGGNSESVIEKIKNIVDDSSAKAEVLDDIAGLAASLEIEAKPQGFWSQEEFQKLGEVKIMLKESRLQEPQQCKLAAYLPNFGEFIEETITFPDEDSALRIAFAQLQQASVLSGMIGGYIRELGVDFVPRKKGEETHLLVNGLLDAKRGAIVAYPSRVEKHEDGYILQTYMLCYRDPDSKVDGSVGIEIRSEEDFEKYKELITEKQKQLAVSRVLFHVVDRHPELEVSYQRGSIDFRDFVESRKLVVIKPCVRMVSGEKTLMVQVAAIRPDGKIINTVCEHTADLEKVIAETQQRAKEGHIPVLRGSVEETGKLSTASCVPPIPEGMSVADLNGFLELWDQANFLPPPEGLPRKRMALELAVKRIQEQIPFIGLSDDARANHKFFMNLQAFMLNNLFELRKIKDSQPETVAATLIEFSQWFEFDKENPACAVRVMGDAEQRYAGLKGTLGTTIMHGDVHSQAHQWVNQLKKGVVDTMVMKAGGGGDQNAHQRNWFYQALHQQGVMITSIADVEEVFSDLGKVVYSTSKEVLDKFSEEFNPETIIMFVQSKTNEHLASLTGEELGKVMLQYRAILLETVNEFKLFTGKESKALADLQEKQQIELAKARESQSQYDESVVFQEFERRRKLLLAKMLFDGEARLMRDTDKDDPDTMMAIPEMTREGVRILLESVGVFGLAPREFDFDAGAASSSSGGGASSSSSAGPDDAIRAPDMPYTERLL